MTRLPSWQGKKFLILMGATTAIAFLVMIRLSVDTVPIGHIHARIVLCKTHEIVSELKEILSLTKLGSDSNHRLLLVAERLANTIKRLDPKFRHFRKHKKPVKANTPLEFCPETFTKMIDAEPYFLNGSWIQENCSNIVPIVRLVTIIVVVNDNSSGINELRKAIEDTHPEIIRYFAVPGVHISKTNDKHVNHAFSSDTVLYNDSQPAGQVWNMLVSKVTTPYVLIGRNLDNFSWLTFVRRQVSIISDNLRVQVTGGSVRNLTGHWEVGCYQSSMSNYILEYKDGYYSSKNGCMICDHLLGPFVARTSIFGQVPLDDTLPASVVFEDWFFRLKRERHVVMTCPDALYFASDPLANSKVDPSHKEVWIPFIKKWELNRIVLTDNVKMSFTCKQSGLDCTNLKQKVGKRMLPICCMDEMVNAMRVFHELCVKNGLVYNFVSGTLLGAVKFRGIIPWDFDGDAEYYASNTSFFLEWSEKQLNAGQVIYLNVTDNQPRPPGFFKLYTPDMYIEMWAFNRTPADIVMPEVFRRIPTKMRIHGIWLYGPPSPGLRARNEYGREMLKHSNSWYHTGKQSFKDPYSLQNEFVPCVNPEDHACAGHFSTDGSLQFAIP